jgi:uncharacterized protein (TIGR02246 family)
MTDIEPRQAISALVTDFAEAQLACDADRLAEMLTADFTLVGPLGYVVERDNWLGQYRSGALKQTAFALEEPQVRVYDGAAVVIANQVQTTTYGDRDASGAFRVTLFAVPQGDRWRLAGMHLSPMPPATPLNQG